MKSTKTIIAALSLMVSTLSLQSCLNDDDNDSYNIVTPNALVTVKPNSDNSSFYLQLDDSTILRATNIKTSPYGTKQVRALVNYKAEGKPQSSTTVPGMSEQNVTVNWIDSILTKPTAPNYNESDNITQYGSDPVEIINDWVTVAEDGYLTLRFRTLWGTSTQHCVNLVRRFDVNTPNFFTFYHDAKGDTGGTMGDALVAFKLPELGEPNGQVVELTLQWKSFSGIKTTTFKYRMPKAAVVD